MNDTGWDSVYAFFMNAYHLGDWMISDGAVTKDQWNCFVRENFELGLCRDLCNGLKHRRLIHPPTVDPSPWTFREYVATTPGGGERWYVRAGEEKHFYLMTGLIDAILKLLKSYANSIG